MTYEAFKGELYRNLRQQKKGEERQILLFEKGQVYEREDIRNILRMISLSDYGQENVVVREDLLCVLWKRQGVIHVLHWKLRTLYEKYKQEGWQGVLPQMVAKMRQVYGRFGKGEDEGQQERLYVKPLHYPDYRGELESGIYWRFGDIALVLYLLVQEDEENLVTMKLQRDMTEHWGMSDETLLTNALLNTYAKMPPRLYHGRDIRSEYDDRYGVFMPGEEGVGIRLHPANERECRHGYILTTTRRRNGAVALFYPGVKERLAELLRGDYYVAFTGIHEAVIHPVRYKVLRELKEAIYRTNIMFERDEMLSDRVYRYSQARRELIEV